MTDAATTGAAATGWATPDQAPDPRPGRNDEDIAAWEALTKKVARVAEANGWSKAEVARRANLVKVEEGKAYAESEQLMELRRLELLTGILGDSDKVYFVPQGTDLTLFLAGQSEAVPVAQQHIAPQMSTP